MDNNLYEMIFKRKSFHLFRNIGNQKISEAELKDIENKFNDLETQKNDLNTAFLELKEKHNKTVENDANTDVKVTELNTTLENKSKEAEENLQKYLDLKIQINL